MLHHSDRGGQYASLTYQELLEAYRITVSMSRTADPYDNALMESCIGTLKTECADHVFPSRQVARSELFALSGRLVQPATATFGAWLHQS